MTCRREHRQPTKLLNGVGACSARPAFVSYDAAIVVVSTRTPTPIVDDTATLRR
jgi:hypothetical protein